MDKILRRTKFLSNNKDSGMHCYNKVFRTWFKKRAWGKTRSSVKIQHLFCKLIANLPKSWNKWNKLRNQHTNQLFSHADFLRTGNLKKWIWFIIWICRLHVSGQWQNARVLSTDWYKVLRRSWTELFLYLLRSKCPRMFLLSIWIRSQFRLNKNISNKSGV